MYLFFRLSIFYLKVSNFYSISIYRTIVEKYIYFNKLLIDGLSFCMFYISYYITYLLIDKGLVEHFGPFGLFNVVRSMVVRTKYFENYYTTHYVLFILVAYLFLFMLLV